MNIEKQIEGVNDEEDVNHGRLNSNNNDKKKIIMYVVWRLYCFTFMREHYYLFSDN